MQQINGVQISVLSNDGKLRLLSADGLIGHPDATFYLQARVAPNCHLYGFTVDGAKKVVNKKNVLAEPNSGKLYELKVSVYKNDRGQPYTVYPNNNLRLVEQLGRDGTAQFDANGRVRIWEIGLVAQRGLLFLTVQPTYEAECHQDRHGTRLYPYFAHWPQLNRYLVSLLPTSVVPSPLCNYEPEPESGHNGLELNEGLVAWYNDAHGLGCIVTRQGNAKVHWSEIRTRRAHTSRVFLLDGEKVNFSSLQSPRKTSTRPTGFKLEAIGVRLA